MSMENDKSTIEPTNPDLPDRGIGESVRAVPDNAAPVKLAGGAIIDDRPDRPPRQRNLRSTFRVVPSGPVVCTTVDDPTAFNPFAAGADPGFPGSRLFAP